MDSRPFLGEGQEQGLGGGASGAALRMGRCVERGVSLEPQFHAFETSLRDLLLGVDDVVFGKNRRG